MTTEDDKQAAYVEARRAWAEDPENGLRPYPKRRTRRSPDPAVIDDEDPELG